MKRVLAKAIEALSILFGLAAFTALIGLTCLLAETHQPCELRANPPGPATAHALAQHAPARMPTRATRRQGVGDFSQDQIAGLMAQLEHAR
jgi:hypothetical protein